MSITLRQLSYFVALAEAQNFGRAAEMVHVSQPALSMQIKELERILDVSLVERLPRQARLTRAGRALLIRARRVLSEVAALEGAARREGRSARLHIGMIPTIAPYLLPQVLPLLQGQDLRLREAQTEVLLAELEQGRLDAVVIAAPDHHLDLTITPLFEDRFLLAATHTRLTALGDSRENLRPKALDPEELLLLDEGHCLADQALEVCGLDRRRLRLDLGASSLSTLCGLVGQGYGLTFVPEIAAIAEGRAHENMAMVRFTKPEPARRIVLARLGGAPDGPWFDDLAACLGAAGNALIAQARQTLATVT